LNSKAINFIKNFSYTLSSNLISLIVSSLVVLIIPKLIGVEEYGFWQLYLFYSSYVGFMHFGWNDGIYLRYGGEKYENLNKQLFFSQFTMLFFLQLLIAILIVIYSIFSIDDANRLFILQMVALVLVIMNMRTMLLFILQATNRIKNYAQITMLDRIIYIILVSSFLFFGVREYKLMIVADITSKALSLIYAMYCCKEMIFRKFSVFSLSIRESVENINVGIKLMFANIASMLIIGVVRFGIERSWDVSTFGKVSLTLSISKLTMLFINAVGVIMFPILRRTDERKLPHIYGVMRDLLMTISLGVLIVYYPFKIIMISWLPEYSEGLIYMALVFPLFIYEGKMALLINTYLKTLRQEKLMLRVNVISLILSLASTLVTVKLIRNLDLAVVSVVLLLAFRSALAELLLANKLKISVVKDIILETGLTLAFILSAWFVDSWYTVLIYGVVYLAYIFIKRKDIINTVNSIKLLIRSEEAI
jgi:O-antigen/teichoic acid export membrane protein